MTRRDLFETAWPLGRSAVPRGISLHVPYDRTTGIIGPQGSGKTLDALVHAESSAPGGLLQTSSKPGDVLLSWPARIAGDFPAVIADPYGLLPGFPPFVWDLLSGCVDSMVATRRAKAFAAGTVRGAVSAGGRDDGARFYAREAAKVLQAYFHAAALTGRTWQHVMAWIANPTGSEVAQRILNEHPLAEPNWSGYLRGSLAGAPETVANTIATVQQSMDAFMHDSVVSRCIAGPGRPATDIAELIESGGTIYLLGKDDPYTTVAPLMTAITDDVLDTAERLAVESPWGRLAPPFMAALDELPAIAPIPTLPQRMADGRGRGLSIVWAAQAWRQLVTCYGEDVARTILAITNVLVIFGGGKDVRFNHEMSDLIGTVEVDRRSYSHGRGQSSRQTSIHDVPTLRPHELGRIKDRHAVVLAGHHPAILARLDRVLDGRAGRRLQAEIDELQTSTVASRQEESTIRERTRSALTASRAFGLLHPDAANPPRDDHDDIDG